MFVQLHEVMRREKNDEKKDRKEKEIRERTKEKYSDQCRVPVKREH